MARHDSFILLKCKCIMKIHEIATTLAPKFVGAGSKTDLTGFPKPMEEDVRRCATLVLQTHKGTATEEQDISCVHLQ